jgi:hypothetical protein
VWLLVVFAQWCAACGDQPQPAAPTPAPAAFVRMDIDGPTVQGVGRPGDTLQLRAIATFSDGTRPDVTADAGWSVVDPRVVSVSRGLVTALADGATIVTATYRGWSNVTNVQVDATAGRRIRGIVRDAERGTPLAGVELRVPGQGLPLVAATDGNGTFDAGELPRVSSLLASLFGYEDKVVALGNAGDAAALDVRLVPNSGRFIERRLDGTFDAFEDGRGVHTVRLSTVAGGVFDAEVFSTNCDYNGTVELSARSGGMTFTGQYSSYCHGRLRFVVPASGVELRITGFKAANFQLTYREPR